MYHVFVCVFLLYLLIWNSMQQNRSQKLTAVQLVTNFTAMHGKKVFIIHDPILGLH
jgi:hypothetical protein